MNKKTPDNDEELEDSDFDFEDTSSFEETSSFDEELEESETDEEEATKTFGEDLSIDEDLSEIEPSEATVVEKTPEPAAPPAAEPAPSLAAAAPTLTSKPTKLEEVPLSISIEVGRLELSLQQLLQLQPGRLLELKVRPQDGVDLVFNGKKVARGELVRLGEVLGVRILEKES